MWIGCASAVKLWISHTSVAPTATFLGDRIGPAQRMSGAVRVDGPEQRGDRSVEARMRAQPLSDTRRVSVSDPASAARAAARGLGRVGRLG